MLHPNFAQIIRIPELFFQPYRATANDELGYPAADIDRCNIKFLHQPILSFS